MLYENPSYDILIGCQHGDEAKGKIAKSLAHRYTHIVKFNGGANSGTTIIYNGKKCINHIIPVGVFTWNDRWGKKTTTLDKNYSCSTGWNIDSSSITNKYPISIIGSNCVVHPQSFLSEVEELRNLGLTIDNSMLKIANNAFVVEDFHIVEDRQKDAIGSTKRGITFAYRDKILKTARRVCDVPELKEWICDPVMELMGRNNKILFQGGQGFGLDLSFGDYPYVTSSNCISSVAMLNGVPPHGLCDVWGAAKIYETYVGNKNFEPDNVIFDKLREIGQEYGATTGRPRKCNWLDLSFLTKSIYLNGVTHLVISKVDILTELNHFEIRNPNTTFSSVEDMKDFIGLKLQREFPKLHIFWSSSPEHYDR